MSALLRFVFVAGALACTAPASPTDESPSPADASRPTADTGTVDPDLVAPVVLQQALWTEPLEQATLTWTPSLQSDFAAYEVYRDAEPAVSDVHERIATITEQSTTSVVVPVGADEGSPYFRVYVRLVDGRGAGSNVEILHGVHSLVEVLSPDEVGSREISGPMDVTFLPDGAYAVAEAGLQRVQLFEPNDTFRAVVTTTGSGPDQTGRINAVEVADYDGAGPHLYVADAGNDRLHVHTLDGDWVGGWDLLGAPADIAVLPDGKVYTADFERGRVEWGDPGDPRGTWRGPADDDFDLLSVAARADGLLFVLSLAEGPVIHRYRGDGTYLSSIDGLEGAGVCVSQCARLEIGPGDRLYLTDLRENVVHVLSPDGAPIQDIDLAGVLDGPVGMGFAPDGRLYVAGLRDSRIAILSP